MTTPPVYTVRLRMGGGGKPVLRDGRLVIELQCPMCGVWATLDDDQVQGRVSAACVTPGCPFHETVRFIDFLREEDVP